MARGQIEYYPRLGVYIVIDTKFNTIAIQTTESRLAERVRALVNACRHDRPYDLLWHNYEQNREKHAQAKGFKRQ